MADRLRSDDWTVLPCDLQAAARLVVAHHYSMSTANTATYRHGLYRVPVQALDAPVGAALWMPPTRAAAERTLLDVGRDPDGWRGVLALSRLVVAPYVPGNGASFLMARSRRMVDRERWPVLVTYADTAQGHTGAIYRATNWVELGPVSAGDCWVGPDGEQRGRKRGPRTLTRAEMEAAGYVANAKAPKIKFVDVA